MTPPTPPTARRVPTTVERHGVTHTDDYAWLRERADPEVRAYLEAENAYTEAITAPTRPLQESLYAEMLARIQETDVNVPYPERGYFYYSRTEEGRQYAILCRKKGRLEAEEEITLDLNRLAEGHPFLSLGAYLPNDGGSRLAYSTDTTGFRQYTLRVKDLDTGETGPIVAEKVGSVAWAADGRTIFYTVEEESTKRQYRLYRHVLGTTEHTLVLEEPDLAFDLAVGRTRSGAYLILLATSHTTTESRVLSAADPEGEWRLVAPRIPDQEYDLDHHGDTFYIRTNDTGRNFRLVTAPVDAPGRESWTELVPHRPDVMLEGIDCFAEHTVLCERTKGLPRFRVLDRRPGPVHDITFPEPTYDAGPSANREFRTRRLRYTYQSLTTPGSVFEYDLDTRQSALLKEQPVLGGYDRTLYASERAHAVAADGTEIPVSLVYRKDAVGRGPAPLHLTGYGAYGLPYPVHFSSSRLSLLDRGVVMAIAHVRGGGEMGKAWHDAGRMRHKRNTFTDFIAVADHLVRSRRTTAERMTIEGTSAGGLLVGAVLNARPDLFRAAIARVPFLDVVNTMWDESLPLTVPEFEEWGNPKVKDDYDVIAAYCPYTNLAAKAYPGLLVKTSFHDSQVMYWEPAKYVAKRRALGADGPAVLLKTNLGAGHGGASGRYDALREVAFDYAFLLTQLGLAAG